MDRADILEAARKCVCGERQDDYGSPEDNFAVIAAFWEVYLRKRCVTMSGPDDVSLVVGPDDVANMMCLFKLARITTGTGTADSYIDLAGYAACGGEIVQRWTEVDGGDEELHDDEEEAE